MKKKTGLTCSRFSKLGGSSFNWGGFGFPTQTKIKDFLPPLLGEASLRLSMNPNLIKLSNFRGIKSSGGIA